MASPFLRYLRSERADLSEKRAAWERKLREFTTPGRRMATSAAQDWIDIYTREIARVDRAIRTEEERAA